MLESLQSFLANREELKGLEINTEFRALKSANRDEVFPFLKSDATQLHTIQLQRRKDGSENVSTQQLFKL